MSEPWPTALLALYNSLPELREQRDRYHQFWNLIGAVGFTGWLVALALYRVRRLRHPHMGRVVGVAFALGGGLGWLVWSGLSGHSWGDVGVGARWLGELVACVLGCVGWLLAAALLLWYREVNRPVPTHAAQAK